MSINKTCAISSFFPRRSLLAEQRRSDVASSCMPGRAAGSNANIDLSSDFRREEHALLPVVPPEARSTSERCEFLRCYGRQMVPFQ